MNRGVNGRLELIPIALSCGKVAEELPELSQQCHKAGLIPSIRCVCLMNRKFTDLKLSIECCAGDWTTSQQCQYPEYLSRSWRTVCDYNWAPPAILCQVISSHCSVTINNLM